MYWTRTKILVVGAFLASVGGAGVSLLATQEQEPQRKQYVAPAGQGRPAPVAGATTVPQAPASVEQDDPPEVAPPEDKSPEDAARLARDMARSRLNLKKLAIAMHNYADGYGRMPSAATVGKEGKALLSWRVELLPYLGEQALYNQFKRDEPWDSPHNRKLLSKMPAVYAPPGVKTQRPYSTYYQVFVSSGPSSGGAMAGMMPMMGGGGGGPPSMPAGQAPAGGPPGGRMGAGPDAQPSAGGAGGPGPIPMGGAGGMGAMGAAPAGGQHANTPFVKGEATRFPAGFPDGLSNTILIVEAGNPVPWTKPEDLHYAEDEALPELGGLFPNVFHSVFADGAVHTLTKNYDEKQLRYAITANDGMVMDLAKLEARFRRAGAGPRDRASVDAWQQKNEELRRELELARRQIRLLKEEQEVERELAGEDPRITKLKEENARMQSELKKLQGDIESLKRDMRQPRKQKRIEDEEELAPIRPARKQKRVEDEELPRE
jgi:hypothetical protein